MSKMAVIMDMRARLADQLEEIESIFSDPVRATLLVRNLARSDGDRDVLMSNEDDLDVAIAAMHRVRQRTDHIDIPADGMARAHCPGPCRGNPVGTSCCYPTCPVPFAWPLESDAGAGEC